MDRGRKAGDTDRLRRFPKGCRQSRQVEQSLSFIPAPATYNHRVAQCEEPFEPVYRFIGVWQQEPVRVCECASVHFDEADEEAEAGEGRRGRDGAGHSAPRGQLRTWHQQVKSCALWGRR